MFGSTEKRYGTLLSLAIVMMEYPVDVPLSISSN